MYKMNRRVRVNWTLDAKAYNILKRINPKSMSQVVSRLIIEKFQDPVKRIEDENRELAKRIYENQQKIRRMLEDREDPDL
jgi:hypothetical protein